MDFDKSKKGMFIRTDKSDKGGWDKKITNLCQKINKTNKYYTTSSCAGRIVIIKSEEKKQPSLFLFRSHDKISLPKLKKELEKARSVKEVNFKQESCILHIACRNLEAAQALLDKAKQCGWKNSGIIASQRRFVCQLRSTEHIEFLIISQGKLLVDDNFLKLLVKEANSKLKRAWDKINKLEKLV